MEKQKWFFNEENVQKLVELVYGPNYRKYPSASNNAALRRTPKEIAASGGADPIADHEAKWEHRREEIGMGRRER